MNLQEQLQDLIKKRGLSINRVAEDLGYSASVISQWTRGKYTGNVHDVEKSVEQYLVQWSEKSSLVQIDSPFVAIKNAKTVFAVAKRAHLDHKMCMVCAESGLGKTRAAQEYAEKNRTSILIEVNVTFNAKILIATLHKRLGLGGHGSKHSMLMDCIDALKDTDRLIIIDEADLLGNDSLELIRALHDGSRIGILLLGLPELSEQIRGSRGELARINTRITGLANLDHLSEADTSLIVSAYIPHANGTVKTFYALSRKNGRTLQNLIFNTMRVAQEQEKEITDALIETCSRMLAG